MDPMLDDHLKLRRILTGLATDDPAEEARSAVGQLAALLPGHFAEEERPGGFLDRLADHGFAEEVVRLREEHRAILQEIRDLAGSGGEGWRARLTALAQRLEAHEWQESRLAATPALFDPESDPDREQV